jgi:hypothetical protein
MTQSSSGERAAEERLRLQIEAYHASALAYAAVKIGLPEAMGEQARKAAEIAEMLSLSLPHLTRFLRGLVTIGICEERGGGSFALSALGKALAPGSPSRLREKLLIVVEQYWRPWSELPQTLRSGEPAFQHVFGAPVAERRRAHSDAGALFETYLAKEAFASAGPILASLDLSSVKTVAEIGGCGGLLAALLKARHGIEGILIGYAETVAGAETYLADAGVLHRVKRVGSDMLTEIAVAADLYLLTGVLRNFDDEGALAILRNCRRAMPASARLAVIERLLPEHPNDDPAATMLDLHMMTITGGKLRTQAEIETLLMQAGFTPASAQERPGAPGIIEAVPAG